MRCHEARQRIADLEKNGFEPGSDKELMEHLDSCSACASLAEAAKLLERDFETGRTGDTEGGLSFSDLRARVEDTIDKGDTITNRENGIMHKIANSVKSRPRLGISVGLAVILLAFLTLVPFKFEKTIGYEVAIAGVDKNLAMDTDKVQEFFIQLGLCDAKFDVIGCEETCNLKITDLRTEDDAKLVVAAFDKMGNCTLEKVNKISGERTAPLIWYVKGGDNVSFSDDIGEGSHSQDITFDVAMCMQKIDDKTNIYISRVVDSLCPKSDGNFTIWVNADEGDHNLTVADPNDPRCVIIVDSLCMKQIAGSNCIKFCGDSGNMTLEDLHFSDTNENMTAKQSGQIPEGFQLNQNYPNPFNPATTIIYSLPQNEHVTLEIFNMNGQKVKTLVDKVMGAGDHAVVWDACDDAGVKVATGVYLYKMTAGDFSDSKKMSLVK